MSDRQAIVNCTSSPHAKPTKKPALAYAQMYSPILQHQINNEAKIMKKINELAQAVISTTNDTTTLYVSG
jgi:ferritin